jgi:YD repeat-containing protein
LSHGRPSCPAAIADPVKPINVLTGNNRSTETDLSFSTAHEKEFKLYRTYNSRIKLDSPIGYGWRHNYHVVLEPMSAAGPNTYTIRDESNHLHYFQDQWAEGRFVGVRSTSGALTFNMDNSYTWHRPNGITYTFDQYLKLVSKTDGNANVQTLAYDVKNRLASITDEATGRIMGFTYTADDRIAAITGPITTAVPDGIWVRYHYDTLGNLINVQYADNGNGLVKIGVIFWSIWRSQIFPGTRAIGSGWRVPRRRGFPHPEVEFSGLLFAQAPMAEAIAIPRPLERINPALQGPGNVEPVAVPWRYPRA